MHMNTSYPGDDSLPARSNRTAYSLAIAAGRWFSYPRHDSAWLYVVQRLQQCGLIRYSGSSFEAIYAAGRAGTMAKFIGLRRRGRSPSTNTGCAARLWAGAVMCLEVALGTNRGVA